MRTILRTGLPKYVLDPVLELVKGSPKYNAPFQQVDIFGYLGSMRSSGGEVQSMASLRWQR
eukprot:2366833-Prorocentrum_lima.AAC.1